MDNNSNLVIQEPLSELIDEQSYPCIMAKKVSKLGNMHYLEGIDLEDLAADSIKKSLTKLYQQIDEISNTQDEYHSIIIEFKNTLVESEIHFEKLLWGYLQALHDEDAKSYRWNKTVDKDPNSSFFSFSIKEESFYIIGMHPKSSRPARRSKYPSIVLNRHSQFERLREKGVFKTVRDTIRKRDTLYSGNLNPMVEDFGKTSETSQYSGRAVDQESWVCPLKIRS
jgi:FPC/CPF motif-containing protein YcgG